MPSDALTYFHIAKELSSLVEGSRIERIGMPTKEEVILSVKRRVDKKSKLLLLSVSSVHSRVTIINDNSENPLSAFSFLMHLRKHIGGGTITRIDTIPRERIYRIYIQAFDELGYKKNYILYAEMMGRYSNLVLCDERGIITDCLKHTSLDASQKHPVLPGLTYSFPPAPENKISPDERDGVIKLLKNFDGEKLADYLMSSTYGFAPSSMRQLVFDAYSTLTPEPEVVRNNPDAFLGALEKATEFFSPCVSRSSDGAVTDYFYRPYTHLAGTNFESTNTILDAVNLYFNQKTTAVVGGAKTDKLVVAIKNAIKKNEKTLAVLKQKIIDSADAESDKINGELITANIYKIRQGLAEIEVDDYYTGERKTITLDTSLSPQKNAQKYYKSYSKKKTAIEKSEEMIALTQDKNDYYESILVSLLACDGDDAIIAEIAVELENAGVIKKAGVKKKHKPALPLVFTIDGYTVKIGRNNAQNDALVRNSNGGWLWLHTQKIHGSHGVIEGTDIPQETINKVASLVAHFSKASMSANVPVDYTLIKFVKKPSGAPLGKVIYTHQQTVNVTPKKP